MLFENGSAFCDLGNLIGVTKFVKKSFKGFTAFCSSVMRLSLSGAVLLE